MPKNNKNNKDNVNKNDNKLPIEIMNLIIEELNISNKRKQNVLNIYNECFTNGRSIGFEFHLYRSLNNKLNYLNETICKKTSLGNKYTIYNLQEVDYITILEGVKGDAKYGGAYTKGVNNPDEAVWKTILGITGLECSLEIIKNEPYDSEFIKYFMNRYKWYYFESNYMSHIAWDVGIIALYPDNKTFSILLATDFD